MEQRLSKIFKHEKPIIGMVHLRPLPGSPMYDKKKMGMEQIIDIAVKEAGNTVDKIAVVCHVNHPQRAEYMKSELEKRGTFKDIVITTAAGVATVYANDGGIILAI